MNLGSNQRISGRSYLDGQCLIAMPGMSDPRFARSVVYLCAHSEDGAMGIIVNKPAAETRFTELLVQLDVIPSDQAIRLPSQAERMKVLRGGPVETKRGFVLHSADFFLESATLPIDDGICLTATLDRSCSPLGIAPVWTADDTLTIAAEDQASLGLYRVKAAGGPVTRVVDGERVVTGYSLSADGATLAFTASDPVTPASPTPFAPSGLSAVGTGCSRSLRFATRPARGMA